MKFNHFMLILVLVCTGCATTDQGRVAVLDIDFRKPEQIQAGAREAETPYRNWNTAAAVLAKDEPVKEKLTLSWWATLMDMITKLECRITLFRWEYTNIGRKEGPDAGTK